MLNTFTIINRFIRIIRVLLVCAMLSMLIATLLVLVVRLRHSDAIDVFVWYAIIGSIYISLFSIIGLSLSIAIYKTRKMAPWVVFKRTIMLTTALVCSILIFYFCARSTN